MRLVKPNFHIVGNICATDILRNIEMAGRVCYKSEEKNSEEDFEKTKKFVKGIIARGHHSVLEHEKLTVKFIVDRGVSHELVRHRIASFSQESTRYCDYGDGHVTFIIPPWVDLNPGIYGDEQEENVVSKFSNFWLDSMYSAEKYYKNLRLIGWKPEQARSVLPNSLKTEIVISANLREWRHIFNLRAVGTTGKPHPQMVEVMVPLLEYIKYLIPVVFDDIILGEKNEGNKG